MAASALIVVFREDISHEQEAELIKQVSSLPGVVSVDDVQADPGKQAIIKQERARIEARIRAKLPKVPEPTLLAAIIEACRMEDD